ncbi:MAG TPA: arabinan endo-1,5-alpha-L-arabinosidase [Steroidobacteraceae bacterium]|nr:arabinan endo-1,5-alpha-L-arabinosidase [Steroidobacteraceae bacterium]
MPRRGLALALCAWLAPPLPAAGPEYPTDVRIHDPVMIREGDTYYLFGTGNGVSVYSSQDRRAWKQEPPVFDTPPAWTTKVVADFRGHFWAPDISRHDGTYYLFYCVSAGGKITSAIGVATNRTLDSRSPDYRWIDHGIVVQSIPYRDLWNAIDPQLVTDADGTPWLAFGSFWAGLRIAKLAPDRLHLAEPQEWHSLAKRERSVLVDDAEPEPAAIEAPFIFRKDGWYYLFASWDYCCRGVKSNYKVVVGRSRALTGLYLDADGKRMDRGGGTLLIEGNADWPGVGHNSVYEFDGRDWFVVHAYDAHDRGRSKLKILELGWKDGWPALDANALGRQ